MYNVNVSDYLVVKGQPPISRNASCPGGCFGVAGDLRLRRTSCLTCGTDTIHTRSGRGSSSRGSLCVIIAGSVDSLGEL